jgi:heme exporter protein CcmD
MGEYAIFVWLCYGAVILVLTALCYSSWNNKRSDEKKLRALQQEHEEVQSQGKQA